MIIFPALRNSRHLTPPLPHLPGAECTYLAVLSVFDSVACQMQKGRAGPELQGTEHRAGLLQGGGEERHLVGRQREEGWGKGRLEK